LSLFTRASLRASAGQARNEGLPPLEWQQFQRIDPGAEVIMLVGRGSKEHFRDAVHFWLAVLGYWFRDSPFSDAETFFTRVLDDHYTQCKEISLEEWSRIVRRYDFVETPHDFSPHGRFCRAWLVYDAGTEIAALAETNGEFAVFSWELND
jgi:hypothetical protein